MNPTPSNHLTEFRTALDLYETEKKLQYEQTKFLLDQARTYHTVVMGLAYGGFFALWSQAKSITNESGLISCAAAAMLISIGTFVLFTILNMYLLSKATISNAKIARRYDFTPRSPSELQTMTEQIASLRDRINSEIKSSSAFVAILWPWFFYPSLLSGISGMVILLYVYVSHTL
jgi:hypothetical protein